MSEERPTGAIQPKRETIIDRLREHYAQDDLGIDVLGGAGVEMRYPGESEKDAKERREVEKRARKRRRDS